MHGVKFRRQHAVGRYIVDFCCPEHALVIELDGGHHALQADKDQERTDYLAERGYRMLRFWNNEVQAEPDAVLERLVAVLGLPHPNPLPGQGEGAGPEQSLFPSESART